MWLIATDYRGAALVLRNDADAVLAASGALRAKLVDATNAVASEAAQMEDLLQDLETSVIATDIVMVNAVADDPRAAEGPVEAASPP